MKKRRIALGLNQKELALRLGLSQGAIAQLESGRRSPSLDVLVRLSEVLGVTADYLLTGREREIVEVDGLNAADRLLIKRFRDFLLWAGEKGRE
jgi:transcriptional regulator with XRE-family HTH domain